MYSMSGFAPTLDWLVMLYPLYNGVHTIGTMIRVSPYEMVTCKKSPQFVVQRMACLFVLFFTMFGLPFHLDCMANGTGAAMDANFARFFLAISGLLVFTHHEEFARMVHTFYLATCEVASLVGVMSVIMILFALFCKEAYGDIAQIRGHQVIPLPHEPYP